MSCSNSENNQKEKFFIIGVSLVLTFNILKTNSKASDKLELNIESPGIDITVLLLSTSHGGSEVGAVTLQSSKTAILL